MTWRLILGSPERVSQSELFVVLHEIFFFIRSLVSKIAWQQNDISVGGGWVGCMNGLTDRRTNGTKDG